MTTVRGNEPFAAYLLETEDRNMYVLVFPEDEDLSPPETPARLRVTGRVYPGEWRGQSWAHIEVQSYEEVIR